MPYRKLSEAWVFVSHSHLDLQAVRRIRDEMERLGANPLLFFLKASIEDSELDGLIKREIQARNFFVLCDSAKARSSRWVREEQAYVRSLPDKSIHFIDLAAPWKEQQAIIRRAVTAATVFASYSFASADRVMPYLQHLMDNDIAVHEPADLSSGDLWTETVIDELEETARLGVFVGFLTHDTLASAWALAEMQHYVTIAAALPEALPPLFVLLDDLPPDIPAFLRPLVAQRHVLDFRRGAAAENRDRLLHAVVAARRTPPTR